MATTKNPLNRIKEKGLMIPLLLVAIIGALFVGVVIGGNSGNKGSTIQPVAAAKPVPTVTVTAAPITETKTETVVPQACLDALDNADKGFSLAADMTGEFRDAITAIQNQDVSSLQDATGNIETIGGNLSDLADSYNPNKAACRAAAE